MPDAEEVRTRVAAIKASAGLSSTPTRDAPAPRGESELDRTRRHLALVEDLLGRERARATDFELALGEICNLTRKLTGATTQKVHEIAATALGLDLERPEPPSTEPFE